MTWTTTHNRKEGADRRQILLVLLFALILINGCTPKYYSHSHVGYEVETLSPDEAVKFNLKIQVVDVKTNSPMQAVVWVEGNPKGIPTDSKGNLKLRINQPQVVITVKAFYYISDEILVKMVHNQVAKIKVHLLYDENGMLID